MPSCCVNEAGLSAPLAAGRRRLGVRDYLAVDPHFDEQGFTRYVPA